MEVFFRKYLWTLDLAVVGVCATFLALAASSLVETRFAIAPRSPIVGRAARASVATIPGSKRPDAILRRNIFCSICPPIRLDGDPDPAKETDDGPIEPQPTTLPLSLVAVMFAPSPERHRWSTAIIRDNEGKTFGAFGVGSEVHGALIVSIQETRVYLENAGAEEYLDLLAPSKPTSVAPPPPPPRRPPPAAKQPSADAVFLAQLDHGIKKLGKGKYEVQRATLDSVIGNIALLSRSARIIPEIRNGKPSGFRLFAVRPGGPFAKIGLHSGDTIVSINGLDMSSPQKALEVYTKLKSASHVTLGLERGGKQVAQDYTIR